MILPRSSGGRVAVTAGGITSGGPTRTRYWVGGGIMVAGVLAAILWVVVGIGSLSDEIDGFQRVPLGTQPAPSTE